jgi:ubiquinone/menaquinone biosynthesis C-methylase UbiE
MESSPQETLRQMINGYRISQLLYVAAELGIADLLKDGPKPVEELAAASGTHPRVLFRLLRALCSLGILCKLDGDRYGLTAMGEYLQTGSAGSLRAWALLSGGEQYLTWGHLLYSVRTGEIAFDDQHGMSVWQYREQHPQAAEVFNEAMGTVALQIGRAMVKTYDFSKFNKVVDVGGGHGMLLMEILKAFPGLRGVLLDRSKAIQEARERIEAAGLLKRCELVEGDFFEGVPAGGDAYLLLRILHDWEDDQVIRLLKNCRQVMQAQQKLLILERSMNDDNPAPEPALTDLNMMVMMGGRERTDAEYEALLRAAGFELGGIFATASPMHILEGVAA